jgi:hypothetical protein
LPLNPPVSCVDGRVNVFAFRAFPLVVPKGRSPSQYNTHFEHHFRLHRVGEIRRVNRLAVFGTYHLIVALVHEEVSGATSAISLDDIVKFLTHGDQGPKNK